MREKLCGSASARRKGLIGGLILLSLAAVFRNNRAEATSLSQISINSLEERLDMKPDYRKITDDFQSVGDEKTERQLYYEEALAGYPFSAMAPELASLDEKTAAFMIAIAKKESDWGKYAPSKSGDDCYNYWGYKGNDSAQVGGYSCFSSKEEAVEKVSARVENLIGKGVDTPEKFVVWKCGSSCQGHDQAGVAKWIADVKGVLKSLKS